MRPTIKGAAALAAVCAGALALSPAASAVRNGGIADIPSVNQGAGVANLYGADRIGTSLQALSSVTGHFTVALVSTEPSGWVDALSVPVLTQSDTNTYVVYTQKDRLDPRVADLLTKKSSDIDNIYLIGGTGVLSDKVVLDVLRLTAPGAPDAPLYTDDKLVRLAGADRYATSQIVNAWGLDKATFKANGAAAYLKAQKDGWKLAMADEDLAEAKDAQKKADDKDAAAAKALADAQENYSKLAAQYAAEAAKAQGYSDEAATLPAAQAAFAKVQPIMAALSKLSLLSGQSLTDSTNAAMTVEAFATANAKYDKADSNMLKGSEDYKAKTLSAVSTEFDAAQIALTQAVTALANKNAFAYTKGLADQVSAAYFLLDTSMKEGKKVNKDNLVEAAADAADKAKKAKQAVETAEATQKLVAKAVEADKKGEKPAQLLFNNGLKDAFGTMNNGAIFLTTGTDFADALAAAPAAKAAAGAGHKFAILLTNGDKLTDAVKETLTKSLPEENKVAIYAAGGPAAAAAKAGKITLEKSFVGADRYATAAALVDKFYPVNTGHFYAVTSGTTAADAVVAGPYLINNAGGAGIILVAPNAVPAATKGLMTQFMWDTNSLVIVGGPGAVSSPVRKEIAKLAQYED